MKDIEEQIKKGTTTLGIVCKDGIVLAADRRSSMGYLIADQSEKVLQIADFMAVTIAAIFLRFLPSLKLGTHSMIFCMIDYSAVL